MSGSPPPLCRTPSHSQDQPVKASLPLYFEFFLFWVCSIGSYIIISYITAYLIIIFFPLNIFIYSHHLFPFLAFLFLFLAFYCIDYIIPPSCRHALGREE